MKSKMSKWQKLLSCFLLLDILERELRDCHHSIRFFILLFMADAFDLSGIQEYSLKYLSLDILLVFFCFTCSLL